MIRAVLLDLDDTLIDTRAAYRAAVHRVLDRWMPQLAQPAREEAVRHWAEDPRGYFRAFTRGELTLVEQRVRRVVALHETFGGPVLTAAELVEWLELFEAAFERAWAPLPGAGELVTQLRECGYRVGAVTNATRAMQQVKLERVGLAGALPLLACVDDVPRGKPDPAIWRLACARLGVAPEVTCYLGDELDVDAHGAQDAGLVGIWFDRHGTGLTPERVPVVRELRELVGLVAGLAPGGPSPGGPRPGGPRPGTRMDLGPHG